MPSTNRTLRALTALLLLQVGCPPPGAPARAGEGTSPSASNRSRNPAETRDRSQKEGAEPKTGADVTLHRIVERVIDGDTVVLNGGERVRLASVNAPEIDEELGPESGELARAFALGKKALIDGSRRDHYGRLVADIVVDGKSLAAELLRAGLAHIFLIPPVDKKSLPPLVAAQQEAQEAKRGIWATARYQGDFHITSFHANPRGNDTFNLNGEYVRIVNVSTRPQSLRGYALANRCGERFEFADVVVPVGYSAMIHSGHGDDQLDPTKQVKLFWRRQVGAWSNRGDTASLIAPGGKVIDQVTYDPKYRKRYR